MDIIITNEEDLEWVPADFPRAQMKVLFMDPQGGGQVLLLRFDPFCEMPFHTHASSDEAAYVLEGELRHKGPDGEVEIFEKGTFAFFPAGVEHGPFYTEEEESTIISIFYGPLV
jgi:quercetin dioxygenase-like cupin family protein